MTDLADKEKLLVVGGGAHTLSALQDLPKAAKGRHAIRSVMMVAALVRRDARERYILSENDDRYLATMVREGARLGINFSPDLLIKTCNIRHAMRDFTLAAEGKLPDCKADMVGFCFVYYNPHDRYGSCHIDKSLYTQSPRAFEKGIWHAALANTGARYAFNVHKTGEELPTINLVGSQYGIIREGLMCSTGRKIDVLARRGLVAA